MSVRSALTMSVAVALIVAACTNPERPSVEPDTVELPAPMASPSADVDATLAALRDAVASVPSRLLDPIVPYRPSEPESLLQVPRAVVRADLIDPDDGNVVIYDFSDPLASRAGAEDLATYLGSGFGQTNFPVDAQFSVTLIADTVVFTWWSRARSSDPESAEAVFDALRATGEPIEVLK